MSKGGSTTTTTQNTIPQWMSDAGQQTYGEARNYMQSNPVTPYTGEFAPPVNGQTAAAGQQAQANANVGQGDLGAARTMTERAVSGATPGVSVPNFDRAASDRYMSPYVGAVQDRVMQTMNRQNAVDRQSLGDQAAAAHAYGGDRHAVEAAAQGRDQNNNMLDYLARSNEAAYENAQQQFGADRSAQFGADTFNANLDQAGRDRDIAAAGMSKDIGGAASGINTDSIRNLLTSGDAAWNQQGAGDAARYDDFTRTQDEPWSRYADLMGMLAGVPHDSSSTQKQKQSNGWLNTALAVGGMAASAFSDRRLKTAIQRIGTLASGLGVYLFRYLWDAPDAPLRKGVMADEVERLVPRALGPRIMGFATVNYADLGEAL